MYWRHSWENRAESLRKKKRKSGTKSKLTATPATPRKPPALRWRKEPTVDNISGSRCCTHAANPST